MAKYIHWNNKGTTFMIIDDEQNQFFLDIALSVNNIFSEMFIKSLYNVITSIRKFLEDSVVVMDITDITLNADRIQTEFLNSSFADIFNKVYSIMYIYLNDNVPLSKISKNVFKVLELFRNNKELSLEIITTPNYFRKQFQNFVYILSDMKNIVKHTALVFKLKYSLDYLQYKELINVICNKCSTIIDVVDFMRDIHTEINAVEFRTFLKEVDKIYANLIRSGCPIFFSRKDQLWTLFYYENNRLRMKTSETSYIVDGCSIGWRTLYIDKYGDVFPCGRLTSKEFKLGNILMNNFHGLFFSNHIMNEIRYLTAFRTECRKCPLWNVCRGCKAIAYRKYLDLSRRDPHCWINELGDKWI